MKKIIFTLLLFFTVIQTYGQEVIKTEKVTTKRVINIDFTKIYDKKTGKKIKKNDFIKIVNTNPKLKLQHVIGVNGEIEKHLVYYVEQENVKINNRMNPIKKGEVFPNFIAKTIKNSTIELTKEKGKLVILRFELEANSFRFKKNEVKQIDNLINTIENKGDKVKAIIIFASNEQDVKKGFTLLNSNFEVVADGYNFQQKFSIRKFPSTLIIDKNGKLIDYYSDMDDINLTKLINE